MNNKLKHVFAPLFLSVLIVSCSLKNGIETNDAYELAKWRLGWRLIGSSWDKNYELGERQFDSLLNMTGRIETRFLGSGLDILSELGKKEKLISVLAKQDQKALAEICSKEVFTQKLTDFQICKSVVVRDENAVNKVLQMELIKMYIDDQFVRGNVLNDLINKYKLDECELTNQDAVSLDGTNRDRLKEIITEFGFPTRQLVGKEAMQGIFLMIQHADGDKEWQKGQLSNVETAVRQGDMDGQSYAYLYDRIKLNGGEKQRYGTQFKNVDPINRTLELADTEDIEKLDTRRMEMGMMPIKMYEQFMLRNLPK
jgi:hypothetical protein